VDWAYRLDGALKVQNYIPVDVSSLTEAGMINLRRTGTADLDRAMDGIQEVNDWNGVGYQLALLKRSSEFRAVYLKAEPHVVKLAVVCEITGNPSRVEDYKPSFDWSWGIATSLEPHLKHYKFSPEFEVLVRQLIATYAGAYGDLIQKTLDWLKVALNIHIGGGGPHGAFIGVCLSDVDPDLSKRVDELVMLGFGDYQKEVQLGINPPMMQGLIWAVAPNQVHGYAQHAVDSDLLRSGLAIK
jgi:hypothetical protein